MRTTDGDVLARAAASLLLATAACGPTSHVEGQMTWTGSRFAVDYVAPPWELESESEDELRLRIRAEIFGSEIESSPPTHVLVLGVVDGPTSIVDLLPADVQPESSAGTSRDPSDHDLPSLEGLVEIDLADPREIALFELDQLVIRHAGELVHELREFTTETGVVADEYEVVVAPGLFLRVFYLPSEDGTVRAAFASMFELDDGDIDAMAATLRTDLHGPLADEGEG